MSWVSHSNLYNLDITVGIKLFVDERKDGEKKTRLRSLDEIVILIAGVLPRNKTLNGN
jgi:hypothetical protein